MVKKTHILFIVENNSVPHDRRVWNEAQAAKEFGYEVSVICPEDANVKDYPKIINGIRIYRHPRPAEKSGKAALIFEYTNALIWEFLFSIWVFITHRFHIIHSANPPDHIFIIALPFKLFGVKYIFDHHDITPENYVAKFGSKGFFYSILLKMEWLTFKTANFIISTNESYKKIAMRRGGKDEKDIIVVRNGPDLTKISSVAMNPALREGFRYLVGYVGVIGQQEGIENLLQAVKYMVRNKKRTDVKFYIIGTGPYWHEIVKQSINMELEKYIEFTGYIPDQKLYEILNSVDLCINPEFGNEFTNQSTMIKIMEYMTFGKAIVQFYTVEGEVTAGDSAIYVRENSPVLFAEAILSLMDDPERCRKMGEIGRHRIEEKYSWQRQKGNLASAYSAVMKEQKEN